MAYVYVLFLLWCPQKHSYCKTGNVTDGRQDTFARIKWFNTGNQGRMLRYKDYWHLFGVTKHPCTTVVNLCL